MIFVLGNIYNISERNPMKFLLFKIPKPFLFVVRPFWFYDNINDKYKANIFGVISQIFIVIPSLFVLIGLSVFSIFNNARAQQLSDMWINKAYLVLGIMLLTYLAIVIIYRFRTYINKGNKKSKE